MFDHLCEGGKRYSLVFLAIALVLKTDDGSLALLLRLLIFLRRRIEALLIVGYLLGVVYMEMHIVTSLLAVFVEVALNVVHCLSLCLINQQLSVDNFM